jgi:hypothetical protein
MNRFPVPITGAPTGVGRAAAWGARQAALARPVRGPAPALRA